MKIVKQVNTVRLPKVTRSVERALSHAGQKAKEQRWRKIIIIGEGPHGYRIHNSHMKYYELIGMIEYSKHALLNEADE